MSRSVDAGQELAKAAIDNEHCTHVLQLFIAGSSPRSQRAVVAVESICRELFNDKCQLEVVDIFQQPLLAKLEQIVAVPTLIRKVPAPRRLYIGDMSNVHAILASLRAG